MATEAEIKEYNYSIFVGSEEFVAFRTLLSVGSSVDDFARVTQRWQKQGPRPGRIELSE